MENPARRDTPTPDCFRLEELALFQSFDNQALTGVNYYLWHHVGKNETGQPFRFLYALELLFNSEKSLLLSSGDDSEAIQVITAEELLETATRLQQLHGEATIQRMARDQQGFWPTIIGKKMLSVQLSRHASGLYRNDVLLLDFGTASVVVQLPEIGEGLEIIEK